MAKKRISNYGTFLHSTDRPIVSASACSAVDGGTSGCVSPAEIRSVAAVRQVTDLHLWTDEDLHVLACSVIDEAERRKNKCKPDGVKT